MGAKFEGADPAVGTDAADQSIESNAELDAVGDELDAVEVVGSIKWFDVSKGYGFIVPDEGGPDVLLHVTCLRRDGYQTA